MCTVTFLHTGANDFVLTSSRDEAPNRKTISPTSYGINEVNTVFPKDEKAGGTWIGMSDRNRALCVLNGGFEYHERHDNYRLSRGVIVRDLLVVDDLVKDVQEFNLENVEPFTLVLVDYDYDLFLYELVWDGLTKHFKQLDVDEPKIWSSSTLYSPEMKNERHGWFDDFKKGNDLNHDRMMTFHKTAGENNMEYGIIMDRFFVKTTSITQIVKNDDCMTMSFNHLEPDQTTTSLKVLQNIEK